MNFILVCAEKKQPISNPNLKCCGNKHKAFSQECSSSIFQYCYKDIWLQEPLSCSKLRSTKCIVRDNLRGVKKSWPAESGLGDITPKTSPRNP